MRNLAFILTLFTASATAADFRALDIGQPCGPERAWETAQGSTAVPWTPVPEAETYAFKIQEFDREVSALYFCKAETLYMGVYLLPIESLEQAVESFHLLHEQLLSRYGDAHKDTSPWNGTGDKREIATDSREYMAGWRTARVTATLGLSQNEPDEKKGWHVYLVIGAPQIM